MKLPTSTSSSFGERHDYQGDYSEKDEETGWNAFQLRMYDSRIGRWLSTDPYGQHYSPYLSMSNNPVSNVDPDGGNDDHIIHNDDGSIDIIGASGRDIEYNSSGEILGYMEHGEGKLWYGGESNTTVYNSYLTYGAEKGYDWFQNSDFKYQKFGVSINGAIAPLDEKSSVVYEKGYIFETNTPNYVSIGGADGFDIGAGGAIHFMFSDDGSYLANSELEGPATEYSLGLGIVDIVALYPDAGGYIDLSIGLSAGSPIGITRNRTNTHLVPHITSFGF